MPKNGSAARKADCPRWYRRADVPMSVIRRFAREVAQRFHPEKIILFGSYAYGKPHQDSDVDILVVMPAKNEIDQAVRISLSIEHNFPMDLIVRTPKNMKWRLEEGDWFLREIMCRGKVLYDKANRRMGEKGRRRLPGRSSLEEEWRRLLRTNLFPLSVTTPSAPAAAGPL